MGPLLGTGTTTSGQNGFETFGNEWYSTFQKVPRLEPH